MTAPRGWPLDDGKPIPGFVPVGSGGHVSNRNGAGLDILPALEVEVVRTKPLVYVAGPYSSPDPVENTHKAIKIADELYLDGLVTPVLPHLSALWHMVAPHPYEFWLEYDLELLHWCHAVYRFYGESSGADGEVRQALEDDKPVFFKRESLYAWAERWVAP